MHDARSGVKPREADGAGTVGCMVNEYDILSNAAYDFVTMCFIEECTVSNPRHGLG